MQRVTHPSAVADLFGPGKSGFTEGDPAAGREPTTMPASWPNSLQEEVANALEGHGIALDASKNDQLLSLLRALPGPSWALNWRSEGNPVSFNGPPQFLVEDPITRKAMMVDPVGKAVFIPRANEWYTWGNAWGVKEYLCCGLAAGARDASGARSFVAVGEEAAAARSSDSATWYPVEVFPDDGYQELANIMGVGYAGGRWLFAALDNRPGGLKLTVISRQYLTSGSPVSVLSVPLGSAQRVLLEHNGKTGAELVWVVGCSAGSLRRSSNGLSWTAPSSPPNTSGQLTNLKYLPEIDLFWLSTSTREYFVSADGAAWQKVPWEGGEAQAVDVLATVGGGLTVVGPFGQLGVSVSPTSPPEWFSWAGYSSPAWAPSPSYGGTIRHVLGRVGNVGCVVKDGFVGAFWLANPRLVREVCLDGQPTRLAGTAFARFMATSDDYIDMVASQVGW